jgi:hypothetical protein
VGSPLRPALAADDFQRYLGAAVQLYENLEYERALAQVQRARTVAWGIEQDVALGLHEGIFLAELGRWNEARTSFETALLLDPTAKLPLSVSPKVESQFESIRQDVNTVIARRKKGATFVQVVPAPASATTDVKPTGVNSESASPVVDAKPPEQQPVVDAKPPEQQPVVVSETRVEQKPVADTKPLDQQPMVVSDRPERVQPGRLIPPEPSRAMTPTAEVAQRRMPVVPIVLFGAGVLAGSVGGYLVGSRDSSPEDEAMGGIMFGVAGSALVGSVVSWLIVQADTSAEPVAANSAP